MNSEDEVDLLGGGWGVISERKPKPKTKSNTWREPKSCVDPTVPCPLPSMYLILIILSRSQTKVSSSIRVKTRPLTPKTSWKGKAKAEPTISDLLIEELTEYDDWLKITEESVWVSARCSRLLGVALRADTSSGRVKHRRETAGALCGRSRRMLERRCARIKG
jgi:hypothetical protein